VDDRISEPDIMSRKVIEQAIHIGSPSDGHRRRARRRHLRHQQFLVFDQMILTSIAAAFRYAARSSIYSIEKTGLRETTFDFFGQTGELKTQAPVRDPPSRSGLPARRRRATPESFQPASESWAS
jgi:hypothetical protein